MSGDVALTSALRNNLLSLQQTQRTIDETQLRLSTGKRVNSALDNPLNFFRAESFSNRANDLNTLLDGIALSIRTIEEADAGVSAVLAQLDSAQSLVDQAQQEVNSNDGAQTVANLAVQTAGTTAVTGGITIGALLGDISGAPGITFTLDAGEDNTDGGPFTFAVASSDDIDALISGLATINGDGSLEIGGSTDPISATITGGVLSITIANGLDIDSFTISVTGADGTVTVDNTVIGNGDETRIFTGSRTTLQDIADRFDRTLNEITAIVGDASVQGINLLQDDDLLTIFNEDGSSTLTTFGEDFTATGLGLSAFDGETFTGQSAVSSRRNELSDAIRDVRNFGATIANDLSIIETRRTFTEATVNTLRGAADDLTLADLNEEGANLLALQTRQQLGVTSLSLASQSQQSVLRLF